MRNIVPGDGLGAADLPEHGVRFDLPPDYAERAAEFRQRVEQRQAERRTRQAERQAERRARGQPMIEQLLPAGVASAEAFADPPGLVLLPAEQSLISRAVEKRRREFTTVGTAPARRWASSV